MIRESIDRLGLDYEVREDEAFAPCPAHEARTGSPDSNPSWSINLTTGMHYCFSCHWKGNLATLTSFLLGVSYDEAKEWSGGLINPKELQLTVKRLQEIRRAPKTPQRVDVSEFLAFDVPTPALLDSRRISEESATKYDLRTYRGGWIIPVHLPGGQLIGWQYKNGRTVRNRPRGMLKRHCVFGYEQAQESSIVVVVESPLDAVLADSFGCPYPTVALFGSAASAEQLSILSGFYPILALDNDPAGRKGSDDISHTLIERGIRHRVVQWKEHVVGAVKDFGDVPELIPALVESAKDPALILLGNRT